ncbi:MAG TPA: dTMP kinase [Acidimicrobiales bacterium]|nr:dTMP kinase [Acidimicrobiales bacterium]
MPGRLIALEGIDGSGKTTQARLLAARLDPSVVTLTAEPGGTALGAALRRLLLDPERGPMTGRAEALLLAADRAQHVAEVVAPALAVGRWVVTDRFSGSTLAYQGYGRDLGLEGLRGLVRFAAEGIEADVNVLVDVPVAVAQDRRGRGPGDRFEQAGERFQEVVRAGYQALAEAEPTRWVVVDGTGEVEDVAAALLAAVNERVGPLPTVGG